MSIYVIIANHGAPGELIMGTAGGRDTAELIAADLRADARYASQSISVREIDGESDADPWTDNTARTL